MLRLQVYEQLAYRAAEGLVRLGCSGAVVVMPTTPGRFSKRAFASRDTTMRPVSAAWAAMIRPWSPRGWPARRLRAGRRACWSAVLLEAG